MLTYLIVLLIFAGIFASDYISQSRKRSFLNYVDHNWFGYTIAAAIAGTAISLIVLAFAPANLVETGRQDLVEVKGAFVRTGATSTSNQSETDMATEFTYYTEGPVLPETHTAHADNSTIVLMSEGETPQAIHLMEEEPGWWWWFSFPIPDWGHRETVKLSIPENGIRPGNP